MPEILTMPQRSYEWYAARMGIPTASEFGEIMAKGRGSAPSVRRGNYMNHVLAERLSRELDENYTGADALRGVELEDAAIHAYEFEAGVKVKRIGLVRNGIAGASPDGIVGDDGLAEAKCPRRHHFVRMLRSEDPAADYHWQVQGQLWISERKWCDVLIYSPPLPLRVKRVYPDEDAHEQLALHVASFAVELDEEEAALRRKLGMDNAPPLDALEEMIGRN